MIVFTIIFALCIVSLNPFGLSAGWISALWIGIVLDFVLILWGILNG